ncbi:hypothetical protein MYX76_14075 [Desulfobacterota bacterium AH_259_B03_O07]|nr:hypothetical protein [Desulfobacterota bacterium AH_259_B03_O07]
MIIKTFLTLVVALSYVMCSYAENWEKVGDRSSKFQGIARYFGEQPGVKQKDVIEAFQNYDYEVYIDTDSLKKVGDDKRNASHKVVFVQEHDLAETDKKFKYVLTELSFDCALDVIWFIRGGVYDANGELLRDTRAVYIAVELTNLKRDSMERLTWEKVCLHKKLK